MYATCDQKGRLELWETLAYINQQWQLPWIVGGDFNVVISHEEKLGGLPVLHKETADFRQCLNTCGLEDLGYEGSIFTWWNGRDQDSIILKRLDKVLGKQKILDLFLKIKVKHLIRNRSDHCPLALECYNKMGAIVKNFFSIFG